MKEEWVFKKSKRTSQTDFTLKQVKLFNNLIQNPAYPSNLFS